MALRSGRTRCCDIAWLAGAFDGEGSFAFRPQPRAGRSYVARLIWYNSNAEFIAKVDRLLRALGVTATLVRPYSITPNAIVHRVSINGNANTRLALRVMLPHLTARRMKGELLLAFLDKVVVGRRRKTRWPPALGDEAAALRAVICPRARPTVGRAPPAEADHDLAAVAVPPSDRFTSNDSPSRTRPTNATPVVAINGG